MVKEQAQPRIIPINNGYYNYKSLDGEIFKSCCIKSVYGKIKSSADTLIYDNEIWSVGFGEPNLTMDKTGTEDTKVLILNMLCRLMKGNKESFKLVLSAPPLAYEDQATNLPMYLRGKYDIVWNDEPKEITIEDAVVLPETFMVFKANNKNGKYNDRIVYIFDIGGFTTNVVRIEMGDFSTDDFITLEHGMWNLDFEISQFLSSKITGNKTFRCEAKDIPYYRKNGLHLNGKNEDYMEIYKNEIDNIYIKFINHIIQKCTEKGWTIDTYDKLITGGGGMLLYPLIKEVFYEDAELSDDPIFDNLKGLNAYKESVFEE